MALAMTVPRRGLAIAQIVGDTVQLFDRVADRRESGLECA